ncbi:MAG: class I adenylate-forming enzyme family protein [Desulfatibacillaceae bacterium]
MAHRQDMAEVVARLLAKPENPDREFVPDQWTYGRVYAEARGIARAVAAEKTNGPVVLAENGHGFVAAALIAAVAGGFTLAVPHSFSPATLAELRRATGAGLVLGHVDRLPEGYARLAWEPGKGAGLDTREADPNRPMLLLYTGGTTGRPKIWSKTPANLFGEGAHLTQKFRMGPGDVIVSSASPQHIYGMLFAVAAPLMAGARVIPGSPVFAAEIARSMAIHRATVYVGAPPHYHALRGGITAPDSLRVAFSSGGFLPEDAGEAFFRHTNVGPVEVYGSTETGGVATRQRSEGETSWTPFHTVDVVVEEQRLLVASDYLSPELETDDRGLYTTGDRAEPALGGRFVLLGRADGVVKVGGRRVELAEVEEKLRGLAFVEDVAVLSVPARGSRENEIVAVVAAKGTVTEEAFFTEAAKVLEPSARPRRVRIVGALPRTGAGKADRGALLKLVE